MKKKVLALGLMNEQLHGIKHASKQGLYIIGIDRMISEEVRPYVDEFFQIDLKDEQKIIQVVQDKKIEFIIPSTIGNLLTTVGAVNDALCLPGVTKQWASILTDKDLYSQKLLEKGLYIPKRSTIDDINKLQIKAIINGIGFPCILKPSMGSGSRGVIVINNENEIDSSIDYATSSLLSQESLIVEEFVEGQEYGVDFELVNGEIKILALRKKMITKLPYRQETGYISNYNQQLLNDIEEDLTKFFRDESRNIVSLGNLDVIEHSTGLYFIEMTMRPAGLGIMYNYLPLVIGYNPVEYLIDKLLGQNRKNIDVNNATYGFFFWDLPMGEIVEIDKKIEEKTLKYELNSDVGDFINIVKKGGDIFPRGYFIVKSDTEEALLTSRIKILNMVKINQ